MHKASLRRNNCWISHQASDSLALMSYQTRTAMPFELKDRLRCSLLTISYLSRSRQTAMIANLANCAAPEWPGFDGAGSYGNSTLHARGL